MSKSAVAKLARLLETERAALLAGDFERIEALIPEKEALVDGFTEASGADLRILSYALMRNGVLLGAAKEGVSNVLSTLEKQRDARSSLSSYDSNGNATRIEQPSRGTERRF